MSRLFRRYGQVATFTLLMASAIVPMMFYSKSDRVPKTDEDLQASLVHNSLPVAK